MSTSSGHGAVEIQGAGRFARPQLVLRRRWRFTSGVAAVAIIVTAITLLPLGFVIWATIQTGWSAAAMLIFRPRVGELLVNTTLLLALTVPLCIVLSTALAWLTERSDIPMAKVWGWLAVAPLAVPAFVQSYSWITLFPALHGLFAGVLVSTLAYFPFLYLPVAATLRRLDPGLEDAASALGDTPWQVFFRVVVPQLRLALCGGALLIGLHLLAEYGLFAMIRFDTFTTAIVDQFQSTNASTAAYMLGGILVLCCLFLLALDVLARGAARYARVGAGAARMPARIRLGRATPLCALLPMVVAVLAIGVPSLTIGHWLMAGGAAVWRWDQIGSALGQTMVLALGGAALTTFAAIPAAWLTARAPGPSQKLLEGCNYVVGALPGVVVSLALVSITVRIALPLYQTVATLLIGYAVMFLPRALIGLRASIAQAPIELEQAAGSLGHSPIRALWAVTIRLAAPGAAAGMALVALGILNELPATQMLAPNGTRTLAMAFWSLSGEIDYAGAAPYALIMVISSLPMIWLLNGQSRRVAGR